MNNNPRMYLIIREDLAYKYIQGGHALAQYALEHPFEFKEWNNGHLICLSVFDGRSLKMKENEFEKREFVFSKFVEPDLESNQPTALAIFENGDIKISKFIKDLKLASK